MATACKLTHNVIELTGIAADWDLTSSDDTDALDLFGKPGIAISSIRFRPGGSADRLVVKEDSATGVTICEMRYGSGGVGVFPNEDLIEYFHGARHRPYIDFSDCTLTSGHKVLIKLP